MKIVFFEAREKEEVTLRELISGHDLFFYSEELNSQNAHLAKGADIVSVFVSSEVRSDIIDTLDGVKLIATRSTGFDHIDVAYAKSKGILVTNVPSYGSHTVAEFTFALLLSLSRKIHLACEQMKEKTSYDIVNLEGFDLFGKTIGVIGTGKIGKNVVRIAKGFGMNVLLNDMFPDENFANEVSFKYVSLEKLLRESDIVSLHTPYNKDTHHLINKDNIFLMKKGSLLINTARGEIIETEALVKALLEEHLSGAGLDVLEGERKLKSPSSSVMGDTQNSDYKTLVEDNVLVDMPQVIVTPHIAFFSKEAEMEIIRTTANNISSFVEGGRSNIVS